MTQGYSGSFAVNGTNLILPPTTSGWGARSELGIDGGGHPIYPAVREYEMTWGLAHPNDVKQLLDAYAICASTGTVVFDLPQWSADGYIFYSYSGCTMREPKVGDYFNEYIEDVKVNILMVRTN